MDFDVIVIGAGAAGMMCAAQAGQRGRRVLLVDHRPSIGDRIRISGGGRCNFTNRSVGAEHYLSRNPHFCRSALARFTARDFVALVERHAIPYHERDHGQLFCDETAQDVVGLLRAECDRGAVRWANPCSVDGISSTSGTDGSRFDVATDRGTFRCASVVVATGGLAVAPLGATPFGYEVAQQFGLRLVPTAPALVPLSLDPVTVDALAPLAGVAFDATAACDGGPDEGFTERVLITHKGLSGPAILQISSYWQQQRLETGRGGPLTLDLLPGVDGQAWLHDRRDSRALLANALADAMPRRFAHEWCALLGFDTPLHQMTTAERRTVGSALNAWTFTPTGTLGYAKAEVTLGGVDTADLSSKTMEATRVPGLFFVGEVVDVTGWLGGYNFQWAWSSGWVAGQYA
jgi:predicted Rossmann fold flavoprotein